VLLISFLQQNWKKKEKACYDFGGARKKFAREIFF
jgi:hypothetical protein